MVAEASTILRKQAYIEYHYRDIKICIAQHCYQGFCDFIDHHFVFITPYHTDNL